MKGEANHGSFGRAVIRRIGSLSIKALMPLPSVLGGGPDQEQGTKYPSHYQPEEHGRNVRRRRGGNRLQRMVRTVPESAFRLPVRWICETVVPSPSYGVRETHRKPSVPILSTCLGPVGAVLLPIFASAVALVSKYIRRTSSAPNVSRSRSA